MCQPASSARAGQSPQTVLSVGAEEGPVCQGVPREQQPVSGITATLPAYHGCCASRATPRGPSSPLLPGAAVGLWAASPSLAGPPLLRRAGEEATAPRLLAKTTWVPSHTGAVWLAMSPFPSCSPQGSPTAATPTLPPHLCSHSAFPVRCHHVLGTAGTTPPPESVPNPARC